MNHVENIKRKIGNRIHVLDNGYKIVKYMEFDAGGKSIEVAYLIDGQHRQKVLKDYYEGRYCESDFEVIVLEKHVESEEEIIEYFNALNNTRPIQWSDPNLIINKYISALSTVFNSNKKNPLIRPNAKRPYLSIDKLRESFGKINTDSLKTSTEDIQRFVDRVKKYNQEKIKNADLESTFMEKESKFILRGAELKFMLAVDLSYPWIQKCLWE
jgi:hypothetical protein